MLAAQEPANEPRVKHFDTVIVGCGFAGAATAYHLSRAGGGSILILDKEAVPGFHASGRNASLILQSVAQPLIRELTVASRLGYERCAREIGLAQIGSLLLGTQESLAGCREPARLESRFLRPAEIRAALPVLEDHRFELGLETPSDGVVDIAALLQFYLREARERGVELWLDCELEGVEGPSPYRLATRCGAVEADRLVDAAGAWAARVAALAGAAARPLLPLKRHLFVLDGAPALPDAAPYVWDLEQQFYLRRESGGLLFCVCDETPSESLAPLVEPGIERRLAVTVALHLPALGEATVRRVWSCFRTKTPDGLPLVGADPGLEGFFWVAGLGGHGVGASWEIGRLAACALASGSPPLAALDPGRFSAPGGSDSPPTAT